jgi:hypothetical protein
MTTVASASKTTAAGGGPNTTESGGGGESMAQHRGQCGGIGWAGPTQCVSPYTCKVGNPWYSQCL